jgi:hypothetical protein
VAAITEEVKVTPPGGPEGLAALTARIGPAARLMATAGAGLELTGRIIGRVVQGFAPYAVDGGYAIPGVLNLFTARAP